MTLSAGALVPCNTFRMQLRILREIVQNVVLGPYLGLRLLGLAIIALRLMLPLNYTPSKLPISGL
eukprot:5352774-Ditylum_brightwellii.AAC.1